MIFAAVILLAFAMPASAELVEFKPAANWVSAPDDGSGGPFYLMWVRPRGLGQTGTQFFTPVEVSTSVFSVTQQDLPLLQTATIPEPSSVAWIFVGLALCATVALRRKVDVASKSDIGRSAAGRR
jgi:hypothetical protein